LKKKEEEMSKHYPDGISVDEMENVQPGDTIMNEEHGVLTAIDTCNGSIRMGGLVVQRSTFVRTKGGKEYLLMASIPRD